MNTRILLLLGLICFSCNKTIKQNDETIKEPEPKLVLADIKFKNRIVDFNEVKEGEILSAEYIFYNPSENDLTIDYVNPDCTCTSYDLSSDIISPGDSAKINLKLDTKGKFGKNILHAVVKANTKSKFYKITLNADVVEN